MKDDGTEGAVAHSDDGRAHAPPLQVPKDGLSGVKSFASRR